ERSKLIQISEQPGAAMARPERRSVPLPAAGSAAPADVARIDPQEYLGDPEARTGFGGVAAIDEITIVAVPDLMSAYQPRTIDLEAVKTVQLAVISHCEQMGDRVAVLDPPPGLSAQQVRAWRLEGAGYDSRHATLYYPWISVFDPVSGRNTMVPPSG